MTIKTKAALLERERDKWEGKAGWLAVWLTLLVKNIKGVNVMRGWENGDLREVHIFCR